MALKPLISLDFRHKKRRPWTSLDVEVVEPGGAGTLHSGMSQRPVLLRLHPYACTDNVTPEWGWLMVEVE